MQTQVACSYRRLLDLPTNMCVLMTSTGAVAVVVTRPVTMLADKCVTK